MSDQYPRLQYHEAVPSTLPNLWDGGWRNEAAIKVYLELCAPAFGLRIVENLDATKEAKISRADYLVRFGKPLAPHILETKLDLRDFLTSIGEPGGPLFEGIRTDADAYEPHDISWPSIVFAGTDSKNDRAELEDRYPGTVIVADEDAPDEFRTFSEIQASLERSFEFFAQD